ncbi:MAG TPA: hypothetical protein VJ579_00915 [Candidatus Paceibacterota bacterium]|nr:hypothetical protein [Candidatus Paceibacterota bacterium]
MKRTLFLLPILLTFPAVAFAQQYGSFRELVGFALVIVGYLMQTIFALFSLGIIYTVFKYISALNKGDGKTAGEMRLRLIWGIVGMAVLFSLWGIIYIFTNTLGWSEVGIPILKAPTP